MDKEKLWVISELYFPEITSTGYILTKICEGLTSNFNVNVITGPPSYQGDKSAVKRQEIVNDVSISRVSIPNLNKDKFITRFLRLFLLSFGLALKALFKIERGSKVLIVTNPIPLLLLLSVIARFKNLDLKILVHDVYPDNMVSAGMISKNGVSFKILDFFFKRSFRASNNLIVLGRDMAEVFKKKNYKKDITLIENWADVNILNPVEKSETITIQEQKLQNKTVFMFAGNWGRVQGIPLLLDAINLLKDQQYHFIFAGGGAMEKEIKEKKKSLSLTNLSILGRYKRTDQNEILNACDVGLVTLNKGMYGLGVPSKSYNILAVGKPIFYIGDKNSEVDLMLEEHKIGWSVTPSSAADIANKIKTISTKEISDFSKNALEAVHANYTFEHSLSKFKTVFS